MRHEMSACLGLWGRVVLLTIVATASLPGGVSADEWGQLNALLSKLTVNLGTFNYANGSVQIEAANLQLTGPQVYGLAVSTKAEPSLVTLGLGGTVIGDVTSSPFALYYGKLGGNGSADIHLAIDLQVKLRMPRRAEGQPPTDMKLQSCVAQVPEFSLYCSGGGFTLSAACAAVSAVAPSILEVALCGNGTGGIIGNVVSKYEDIPALLAAAIEYADVATPPAPTPPSQAEAPFVNDTTGIVNFNASGLRTVAKVINGVYGAKDDSGDVVINDALRRLVPEGRTVLSIDSYVPVNKTLFGVTLSGLRITNLTLQHAKFSELELLTPLGRLTTSNRLNMSVDIDLGLTLDFKVGDGPVGPHNSVLVEGVTLSIGVQDLAAELQLLAAIDGHKLGKVTLGNMLQSLGSTFGCLLGSMLPNGLQFTGLELLSGALSYMNITLELKDPKEPGGSGGLNGFIAEGLEALSTLYGEGIRRAVPFLAAKFGAPYISKKAGAAIANHPSCGGKPPPPDAVVDVQKSPLWSLLDAVLNDLTGSVNAPYGINAVVDALVPGGNAALGKGFAFSNNGKALGGISIGNLSLGVQSPRVSGLEDWTKFELVHPAGPTELDTVLAAGGDGPEISLGISLLWTGVGDVLNNTMALSVQLQNASLVADMDPAIDLDRSQDLQLGSLTDTGCLLHSLQGLRMSALMAAVQGVQVVINCTHPITGENTCSSPLLPVAAANLQSPEGKAALTKFFNKAFAFVNKTMTAEQAQAQYDHWVKEAQCPSPAKPAKGTDSSTPGEIVLYVLVAGGVIGVFLVLVIFTTKRMRKVMREAHEAGGEVPPLFQLFECEDAMFWHESTNSWAKWGVPLSLIFSLGCLMSANIDPAATYVNVKLQIAGEHIELDHLFDFSLHVAVVDMWNAGVYPLSFVVALFSGTWAYTKLMVLFWAWFMPPKLLTTGERAPVLEVLDFFGKYSLVDLYVMVMLAVSFRLHMDTSHATREVLPDGFFVMDLIVEPGWGLYGYVIAVFASVIIGHVEIVRHRDLVTTAAVHERERGVANRSEATTSKSTASSWFREGDSDTRKKSLVGHIYKRSPFPKWMTVSVDAYSQGRTGFTKLAGWAQFVLSLFVLITLVSVCVGSFIDSFSFKFKGAAAAAVYITPGEETYRSYSVASLPFKMMEQANSELKNKFGYGFVSACVLITTVICPILQLLALLILWVAPLTLMQHKLAFFITECLSASSAVEVFVIALFAALLQLKQFASFVVGDKCDAINAGMKDLANLGFFPEEQAVCFTVNASLEEGCWLLFSASLVSYVCYALINHAARIAIKEREKAAVGSEHHSFHPGSLSDPDSPRSEAPPRP
eukprot:Hpha_TRINITY_DN16654_c0_g7::TRINITY_DN16654_c0_g7_i2::g.183272::m.183272